MARRIGRLKGGSLKGRGSFTSGVSYGIPETERPTPATATPQRALQPVGGFKKVSGGIPTGSTTRSPLAPTSRRGTINPVGIVRGSGNGKKTGPTRMLAQQQQASRDMAARDMAKTSRKRKTGA